MENNQRKQTRRYRRRRFAENEYHHIYQRTRHRFNIFYDLEDYLVYFTIFSIAVNQYGVTVLGLCLMYDHIHMLLSAPSKVSMSEFVRQVTSMFAREQNNDVGRKGSLFQARFGSAPKRGLKLLRTAIAYLYNNPVEKKQSMTAERYRWNFLAYAVSKHPFSEPVINRNASVYMKRAMKEVDAARKADHHLRYGQLSRLFRKLDSREMDQLVDYIISSYNPIDYEALIQCYGSYDVMLTAINSNTGSEYDIKEDKTWGSDICYDQMLEILREKEGISDVRKVTIFDIDEKLRLYKMLLRDVSCQERQIAEFLHLKLENK